jgi:hypothetical protein
VADEPIDDVVARVLATERAVNLAPSKADAVTLARAVGELVEERDRLRGELDLAWHAPNGGGAEAEVARLTEALEAERTRADGALEIITHRGTAWVQSEAEEAWLAAHRAAREAGGDPS